MTVTIDLAPELEARLREEAAKRGVDAAEFVTQALEERLRQSPEQSSPLPPRVSADEAELLQKINLDISEETWGRYRDLIAKRRAATLTPEEHAELISLSDRIEEANARRVGYLIELSRLRGVSLDALMKELGITAPAPVYG